ncbi:MAG: hypothetical protein NTW49_07055 [Bacteroidia bacterium]|nr:hypothetical protein [Bacteroidia bacterium]
MNISHLHPMTVHFPVALIMVGFLAETIYLFYKKESWLPLAGTCLMILGTLAAVAGFVTGEFFTPEVTGPADSIKETHELFARITMFVMIAACVIRLYTMYKTPGNRNLERLVYTLYLIAFISVGLAGYFGGKIVYDIWLTGVIK